MGSSSFNQNISSSNTSYSNAPVTLDGANPLGLANSSGNKIQTGGSELALGAGAQFNSLDGGAISRAFAFGTEAITAIADLTKKYNENTQQVNQQALGFATGANQAAQTLATNAATPNATSDILNNKTLLIGGFVLVAYFIFKGRK